MVGLRCLVAALWVCRSSGPYYFCGVVAGEARCCALAGAIGSAFGVERTVMLEVEGVVAEIAAATVGIAAGAAVVSFACVLVPVALVVALVASVIVH